MMLAPVERTDSGIIPLTVAAVPTGMKTGVSTSPQAVCTRPRRAAPSVVLSVKLKSGMALPRNGFGARGRVKPQQARIAIGKETVSAVKRMRIGIADRLHTGKGTDKHQQR